MNEQKKDLYMFDLFAGCGGLSTGLEFEGFNPTLVSELNRDALDSYLLNRSFQIGGIPFNQFTDLHFQDVYDIDANKISELKEILEGAGIGLEFGSDEESTLDMICGGPPCQGYSGIGHRRSYGVEKQDIPSNQLYHKMAELIEQFRPKMFLFENVKGLLSARWTKTGEKGEIWSDVRKRFRAIPGYDVRWQLILAKNYGVPQNRPRVLLVGIRNDVIDDCSWLDPSQHPEFAIPCGFLPKPSGIAPHPIELLSDLEDPDIEAMLHSREYSKPFATTKYLTGPTTPIQRELRTRPDGSLLEKGSDLTNQEYSKHSSRVVEKFTLMLGNNGQIPDHYRTKKFAQRLIPDEWDERGPTITATSLPDDYVHYSQPRTLTVREWARLQLFPDWYQFAGKRTTGGLRRAGNPLLGNFEREVPKYTQIGNAVPVGLAQKLGSHFRKILSG